MAEAEDIRGRNRRILLELLAVVSVSFALFWLTPILSWMLTVLPITYLLIEKRIRRRPWAELGVKRQGLKRDLASTWPIVVVVVFVMQFVIVFGSRLVVPSLFERLYGRLAYLMDHFGQAGPTLLFLFLIALATFLEEFTFRSCIQERLSWFTDNKTAIVVSSLLMGIAHMSLGDPAAVVSDYAQVFVDSTLYGLIYARSRSVVLAWTAHMAADYVSTALLLLL